MYVYVIVNIISVAIKKKKKKKICNITVLKFILSGNTDQVDLPGKVTEHREMTRKRDKVIHVLKNRTATKKKKKTLSRNGLGSLCSCTYLQVNSESVGTPFIMRMSIKCFSFKQLICFRLKCP